MLHFQLLLRLKMITAQNYRIGHLIWKNVNKNIPTEQKESLTRLDPERILGNMELQFSCNTILLASNNAVIGPAPLPKIHFTNCNNFKYCFGLFEFWIPYQSYACVGLWQVASPSSLLGNALPWSGGAMQSETVVKIINTYVYNFYYYVVVRS